MNIKQRQYWRKLHEELVNFSAGPWNLHWLYPEVQNHIRHKALSLKYVSKNLNCSNRQPMNWSPNLLLSEGRRVISRKSAKDEFQLVSVFVDRREGPKLNQNSNDELMNNKDRFISHETLRSRRKSFRTNQAENLGEKSQ